MREENPISMHSVRHGLVLLTLVVTAAETLLYALRFYGSIEQHLFVAVALSAMLLKFCLVVGWILRLGEGAPLQPKIILVGFVALSASALITQLLTS